MAHSSPDNGRISVDRFNALLAETTPLAAYLQVRAERIGAGEAFARVGYTPGALRAGGAHSAPALRALIDLCIYAAVLGMIGDDPRPLATNVAITFLRRAPPRDLIAHCNRLGRDSDFVVGSIVVYPDGDESESACASTRTYALPPRPVR